MHRLSLVGLTSSGTFSFGVFMSNEKSTSDHVTTDNRTAKSPMIDRTYENNTSVLEAIRVVYGIWQI